MDKHTLIYFLHFPVIIAAPLLTESSIATKTSQSLDSPTASSFVGFVGDPNGRGTVSLVLSCLLTLILCVWSALHLNIPPPNEHHSSEIIRNVRWITVGVFAPELVVFTAWRQWASAKLLNRATCPTEVHQIAGLKCDGILVTEERQQSDGNEVNSNTTTTSTPRRHPWTKTHDFFATTGGFAFEVRDQSSRGEKDNNQAPSLDALPRRLTLTARGVEFLARCGHLPDIPEADIKDKSKANGLAKALVVIQALWLLIQTLGRLIAGLPVTLLEVNTIAHVCCICLLYIMWWNKPLLPKEPFILEGDWVDSVCAYMYMSSELSGIETKAKPRSRLKKALGSLKWYSKIPELDHLVLRCRRDEGSPTHENSTTVTTAFEPASISCMSHKAEKRKEKKIESAFFERRPRAKDDTVDGSAQSPATLQRWALAAEALQSNPFIRDKYQTHIHDANQCIHLQPEELLVTHVQNWPLDDLLRDVGGLTVGAVLWSASFVYGAIHAAAWRNHFPTLAERWLWRSSAVYISFCGGLWIVICYVAQYCGPLNRFWDRWMHGRTHWYHYILLGLPVVICGSSFCFARVFIVVEAFISIRELPTAAYDTPTWEQVFPHF